jgi:hypothetical protein
MGETRYGGKFVGNGPAASSVADTLLMRDSLRTGGASRGCRGHALIQADGLDRGCPAAGVTSGAAPSLGGETESEGHAAGGLDRLANRLRLAPDMKPSTGQRGRLSVKQPGSPLSPGIAQGIPVVGRLKNKSQELPQETRNHCHGLCSPGPSIDEPVASRKRVLLSRLATVWRQRRKASQCALAMRTPQRKFHPAVPSAPLLVSQHGTPLVGPKVGSGLASPLWSGPSRMLVGLGGWLRRRKPPHHPAVPLAG